MEKSVLMKSLTCPSILVVNSGGINLTLQMYDLQLKHILFQQLLFNVPISLKNKNILHSGTSSTVIVKERIYNQNLTSCS